MLTLLSAFKIRGSRAAGTVPPPAAQRRPFPRRRLMVAGAALLLMATGVGADQLLWRGAYADAVGSAVTSAILDPSAIFAARSPGLRGSGPLLQTKPERVASALPGAAPPGVPEERVLAGLRELPDDPYLVAPGADLPLIGALPGPLPPFGAAESPPGFVPGVGELPPSVMMGPAGVGGPGDVLPPTGVLPSAVPEPSDWMLMILALSGVGAALRWRRSRDQAASPSPVRPRA